MIWKKYKIKVSRRKKSIEYPSHISHPDADICPQASHALSGCPRALILFGGGRLVHFVHFSGPRVDIYWASPAEDQQKYWAASIFFFLVVRNGSNWDTSSLGLRNLGLLVRSDRKEEISNQEFVLLGPFAAEDDGRGEGAGIPPYSGCLANIEITRVSTGWLVTTSWAPW